MEKIKLGSKTFNVKVLKSTEEQEKGLQNVETLPENEGVLFEFEYPDEVSIWMKDTKIPLDIIFINDDLEVISVKEGIPESEELLTENNTLYVLEINKGSNIKIGDDLEFSPDDNIKKDKMYVLDSNGNSQMSLVGGERIMSRKDTKVLIKFAKKANSSKQDKDYKALGKRIFKFLKIQNETPEEYVNK